MNSVKTLALLMLVSGCGSPSGADESRRVSDVVAAAPGRIEGASETFRLGTSIQAPVAKLWVQQGDAVKAGQVLVELECRDIEAETNSLAAKASAAKARHQKLHGGSRPEEIAEASARTRAADAEADRATAYAARIEGLVKRQMMSEASVDVAQRDKRSAIALRDAAKSRETLLRSGARREEIAEAAAEWQALQRASEAARSKFDLCKAVSPVDGVVLKTHVTEGELVTPLKGEPLVSVADLSRMRVRAELDERDIGLVSQGQKVRVLTDTQPRRTVQGVVELVSPSMGRRKTLSTDPAEKSDRDVMEILIGLDGNASDLPVGLRVTVQFLGIAPG